MPKAYAQAGVDIDQADRLLSRLKPLLRKATRPEVLGGIGSFGGLFQINPRAWKEPVLVSSTDGVGTKVKLASLAGRHEGIGFDIVNHCCNDIAVMGAEPLFFLDYFASAKLVPEVYTAVLGSVAKACRAAGCALIGGETAEMPGVYAPGEYDLVGTIVGVVEKRRILTGEAIRPGDVVLGLASDGLHTNGFSLARRIVLEQLGLQPGDRWPGGRGTLGAALLKPHRLYAKVLRELTLAHNLGRDSRQRRGNALFGAAHITGSGLPGNLDRILPPEVDAVLDLRSWTVPPLFRFLVEAGRVDPAESYEVWNMGIGLCLVCDPARVDDLLAQCRALGEKARPIGRIEPGAGTVRLTNGPMVEPASP